MVAPTRRQWLASGLSLAAAGTIARPIQAAPAAGAVQARSTRLSLNESAFGPSPAVRPAVEGAVRGLERYVDQDEVDALARQIAAKEAVDPAQVIVGEVLEALGLFIARDRPGGGTIVYSSPGYTALIDAAAPLGGVGVPVPLNAALENDLPALAGAIDGRTLAVSIVNPHNPSGTVNDAAAFDAFIRTASARTLLVVDEAYLEYDEFDRRSAVRLLREDANIIVFRTLAKIYGLAGLSIGYALAPRSIAERLRAAGIGSPHSLNRLAIAAAAAALSDQAHVRRVADANRAGRERITSALTQKGFRTTDSRGNFVFFDAGIAAASIRTRFAEAGHPVGRAFPPLDSWVRITVGTPEQVLTTVRLIQQLAE